ncbi:hypothetical protein BN2497_473 [Janthinobacterium sp. CG23_2]|nr:hypothetical protein BN2497_473 [Janthinobacterium sp. CG23_2]CUU26634.1 hypothetical protein BN3177_473 [Janthinobacterium sp. CG23_2]
MSDHNEILTPVGVSPIDHVIRVREPGNRPELFKGFTSEDKVPQHYTADPRFGALSTDPAHAGKFTVGGLREAMAGLEAEAQGTIRYPISRGPKEIEFYDADGTPYDVKTPPTIPKVAFDPVKAGSSITRQLNKEFPNGITGEKEPIKVILDSTYLKPEDHAALWDYLNFKVHPDLKKNIIEINTIHP